MMNEIPPRKCRFRSAVVGKNKFIASHNLTQEELREIINDLDKTQKRKKQLNLNSTNKTNTGEKQQCVMTAPSTNVILKIRKKYF